MNGLLKKPSSFANGVEREFKKHKALISFYAQNKDIGTDYY